MAKQIIGAQGEITIIKLDALPAGLKTKSVQRNNRGAIISHSENGNHHVLTGDGDVMERENDVPSGMQILYAILDKPEALVQDAPTPHGGYDLDAGIYEFRIAREYDAFSEQARRVAD